MTSQLHKKGEAWSARFSEPMSELVKRYTSSVFFDKRLALVDIAGSLAHASMLAAQKIISADDLAAIERGMTQIKGEIERGEFEWQLDLEDVHLNIEARLTALIGDAGKRLHTGRSRNDQVATDIRLWLRGEIDRIGGLLNDLRGGFTVLFHNAPRERRARPVRLQHKQDVAERPVFKPRLANFGDPRLTEPLHLTEPERLGVEHAESC